MKTGKLPVRWSENAENDLDNIFSFVNNRDGENRALKLITKIKNSTKNINIFSEKYPKELNCNALNRNIRFYPLFHYKIIYEIKPDSIMIISIFHTFQNPEKLKNL